MKKNYLDKELNYLDSHVANACDELSLWASPFGILLLDNYPVKKIENYLDIGCASGFPLLEIASRLGNGCKAIGIDPWTEAVKRGKAKIEALQLGGLVSIIEGTADNIDFENNYFDLITSNLGINNFENPQKVMKECYRVLKPTGSLCITTNLTGTFNEFYTIFKESLIELDLNKYLLDLDNHINHRGTKESSIKLFEESDFKVVKTIQSEYRMRFYNGSAFLNHPYIIIGFIDSWRNMFEKKDKYVFFDYFEKKLNDYASEKGELELTIPMLYIEGRKE